MPSLIPKVLRLTQRKPIKDRRKRGRATLKRLRRRFVVADFNGGTITTDAGSRLLREVNRKLGLIEMNSRRAEGTTNVLASMLGYSIREIVSAASFLILDDIMNAFRKAYAPSLFLMLVVGIPPIEAQDDIRDLKLRDWQPRSMLKTRVTQVNKPLFPVIDVHNHLGGGSERLTKERVASYLQNMDDAGVQTVVNLDGGWGEKLSQTVAALDLAHPGRFRTFALIDFRGIDDDGWSQRETDRLKESFDAGAKGLKFHKTLGLSHRFPNGVLLSIDDRRLDPIWKLCGEHNKPVMIHTADPAAFFTPLDRYNERWHELNEHPDWLFHGDKYPAREELLAQRNRVIARHPETTFIGAHFGNSPEDLEAVGEWLDAYPNFFVDIDARISELGRQPYSARRFIIAYQDRIMFGTDTTPSAEAYRLYYRFLETDDEYFDSAQSHHRQGFWMICGLYLPTDVLEKVYRGNAAKILGLE